MDNQKRKTLCYSSVLVLLSFDCVAADCQDMSDWTWLVYLRLLVVGGQWSLIADTQVMSSHSYLDSLLLHSQMKVIQVQNYNTSDVFSFLIVQIINTELPNTPAGYTMHNLLCVQQNYQVFWIGETKIFVEYYLNSDSTLCA